MQVFSAEIVLAVYSCSMKKLLGKLRSRKHLRVSLFLTKQQTDNQQFYLRKMFQSQVFYCEFWEVNPNRFVAEHRQGTTYGRCHVKLIYSQDLTSKDLFNVNSCRKSIKL